MKWASSLGSRQYQGNGVRPHLVLHPVRAAGPDSRAIFGHKRRELIGVLAFHDPRHSGDSQVGKVSSRMKLLTPFLFPGLREKSGKC